MALSPSPWFFGDAVGAELQRKWSLTTGTGGADYGTGWVSGAWDNAYPTQASGTINFEADAGDPMDNSVVAIAIQWIMRMFPQAPFMVGELQSGGREPVADHALTLKLKRPNPYYSGLDLWQATAASYAITGNAYWIKNGRNGAGQPQEIYWEHPSTIKPYRARGDKKFLSGYKLYRDFQWLDVPTEDVVHFKFGLDPRNPLQGLSNLQALIREIYTDNEAAMFSSVMLKNLGVPGVIISPKGESGIVDAEELKAKYSEKTTGRKRGEPLVTTDPINVDTLSMSPADMNVVALRGLPVERIPAALGLHRLVIGLGADATFANMEQADEWGYEHCIIPMQTAFAATVGTRLLPDFSTNPDREECYFDTSGIRALQEDQDAVSARVRAEWDDSLLTQNEALVALGREKVKGGDVYKVQTGQAVEFVTSLEEYMTKKAEADQAAADAKQEAQRQATERLQAMNNNGGPSEDSQQQENGPQNGPQSQSGANSDQGAQGAGEEKAAYLDSTKAAQEEARIARAVHDYLAHEYDRIAGHMGK